METLKRHLKHPRKSFVNILWPPKTISTPYRALKANSSKSSQKSKIVGKIAFFQLFSKSSIFSTKNRKSSSETCKTMSKLLPDRFSAMTFWKKNFEKNRFVAFFGTFMHKSLPKWENVKNILMWPSEFDRPLISTSRCKINLQIASLGVLDIL